VPIVTIVILDKCLPEQRDQCDSKEQNQANRLLTVWRTARELPYP